jgi:nitroreductase
VPGLPTTADELLSTTRAVRRRLDLARPVEREVLEECLRLAQQAPTGGNRQNWHFVVVTDAEKRRALAAIYERVARAYLPQLDGLDGLDGEAGRIYRSAWYLVDHLAEVPVHVVPCVEWERSTDGAEPLHGPGAWASVLQGAWSFMLAARGRGLGTVWTSLHLQHEEEAADLLGIPYAQVRQAALIPVAYTLGTDFAPGPRGPLDQIVHWDRW